MVRSLLSLRLRSCTASITRSTSRYKNTTILEQIEERLGDCTHNIIHIIAAIPASQQILNTLSVDYSQYLRVIVSLESLETGFKKCKKLSRSMLLCKNITMLVN